MATTPASSELARTAWAAVAELFLAQRPRINAGLADLGLHPMQALALRFLEPGEPRPMSTLAALLHCDASNVTNIVDRLEAAGLVTRRADARDRRVKTLVLTTLGADVRERVGAVWAEPPAGFAALPPEDLAVLQRILARALGT
jgi:MarR family transcriptional regulator, organic hydroperoxide resistance regulator